nr:RNA-directed DNA polymerase, eukaryota [Tanacetum cinerariifolium]
MHFFSCGDVPKGSHSSFIALIPKVLGANMGDPLSPLLFILIMESLHLSFQRVVEAECFHQVSGLRINMCKSKILGINVADDLVKQATSKIGCLVLKTPFVYLGTKVGAKMSRVNEWNEVIEKVKNRLSKWKVKALSIGGRLTLLKSVLGSMPNFYMSIYRAPSRVLKILESIRNQFFNGNNSSSKKAVWIKWTSVLVDKSKRGLGIASLYALNRSLMIKWVWRFLSQPSALWARVGKAIHGNGGKLKSNNINGKGSCWLEIVKEVIDDSYLPAVSGRTHWIKYVPIKKLQATYSLAAPCLDRLFVKFYCGGMFLTLRWNRMLIG